MLKLVSHPGIAYRLIVGIDHRNESDIGCALYIVLSTQRMNTAAGSSDVTAQKRERDSVSDNA